MENYHEMMERGIQRRKKVVKKRNKLEKEI